MAVPDVGSRLAEVASNLLSLQVNTIVKENMTAGGMPALPHAILDVAGDYAQYLTDLGVTLALFFPDDSGSSSFDPSTVKNPWAPAAEPFVWSNIDLSLQTFDRLRWAAHRAACLPRPDGSGPGAAERVICTRICANSDRIKEILKRDEAKSLFEHTPNRGDLVAVPIDPNAHAALPVEDQIAFRKIWEIGTEQVAAQTVIHIDGDVITRVQGWVHRPGGEPLFAIHRQGLDLAISSWQHLLGAIGTVAGTAVSNLFGGRK